MKKILYVTHLSGKRVSRLWISAITAAAKEGYQIHLACNEEQIEEPGWSDDCKRYGIIDHHINFNRNPLSRDNILAKKQLMELMKKERFDLVHCNTPIGGVLGRICAAKTKIPYVIYQAHGFHFWKGAPLKNWLCYYPVERFLARYTDLLITINKEDYACAQKFKLRHRGRVAYVPGVGVDIDKITEQQVDYDGKRTELGLSHDAIVFISVGELNENKNHITAIKAFALANIPNSHFLLCGVGEKQSELERLCCELGINEKVHFLGFRTDVIEILKISNVFIFPSKREGLSVALMEAMACGLPCAASRIRGNVDLLPNSELLFDSMDNVTLATCMKKALVEDVKKNEIRKNNTVLRECSITAIINKMREVYKVPNR